MLCNCCIVIVRIFIFLWLKVVLQAKLCKEGRCNLEGWSRLLQIFRTQKTTYIRLQRSYNLGQRVFAYNSHTVCWKFLLSPDSLNGAESFCNGHTHFRQESLFTKSYKLETLLGILSDLHETWQAHSSAGPDLKLSIEFCSVKKMCKLFTNTFMELAIKM